MSIKIALLSGAFKNAGDYLIEQRSKMLFERLIPDSEVRVYLRNKIIKEIDNINQCDAVVLSGGPIFMTDLDGYLPLPFLSERLCRPLSIIGGGWYGFGDGNNQVGRYRFSKSTAGFFREIMYKGGVVSARDTLTHEMLVNNGLVQSMLTGCPAWYDLNYINCTEIRSNPNPNNIIISDPADYYNYKSCISLIRYVRERFPSATIKFAFHRGVSAAAKPIVEELTRLCIEKLDLSGNSSGFSIYDHCDLHIGYRVHAHIYNLSIRNKTILIEEDGRGAGVDRTLGLPGIKAYSDLLHSSSLLVHKVYKRTFLYENKRMIDEIESYLNILDKTNNLYFVNAFALQREYFQTMKEAIAKSLTIQ